jgi:glycosyltransferase involved in cell wall biosynthesis
MTAFNHARYIEGAIASVFAQTWKDFELIVVDDGSTDSTGHVVSQFAGAIRYIFQQNRGQGGARNRGIAEARGEFVCFLDDDDLWEPEYLATVMSVFRHKPDTAALYTGFRMIDGEDRLLPQIGGRVVPPHQMYDALLTGGWFPPLVVTVRKACLNQVGQLDETLRGHDDWDLWLRISRKHVFRGIPDTLARYRIHPGGLSANTEHMLQDAKRAIAKHFGPDEGSPNTWPAPRRCAFGAVYRTAALAYIQSGERDRGYLFLDRAFEISPDLLRDLTTFYELALGDQPRGYRGEVKALDIAANSAEMLWRLDALFASAGPAIRAQKSAAYGYAFLALTMLSDQAGDWAGARRYLFRAVRSYPRLLRDPLLVRRWLKLLAGQRNIGLIRRLRLNEAGGSPD